MEDRGGRFWLEHGAKRVQQKGRRNTVELGGHGVSSVSSARQRSHFWPLGTAVV